MRTSSMRVLIVAVALSLMACSRKPKEWATESLGAGGTVTSFDGTSDTDIWTVGRGVHHFDGTRWEKRNDVAWDHLAVAGPNDVWFGGPGATLVHYDGKTFTPIPNPRAQKDYVDIRAIAAWPGQVWVATGQPHYFVYAAGEWTAVQPVEFAGFKVNILWGKRPDDVWANIAAPGVAKLAHLSGGHWRIFDEPPGYGMAGSSTDDVWFFATMKHWDGHTLKSTPYPPRAQIYSIASRSPTDALAVGQNGVVLHWDGSVWSPVESPDRLDLGSVFVGSPTGSYRTRGYGDQVLRRIVP